MARRTNFDDFLDELEDEAAAEGPEAVAELRAWEAHFRLTAQLARRRLELGLTQLELAARTGVAQAEISRLEKGLGNPTLRRLQTISHALGLEVSVTPTPVPKRRPVRRRSGAATARR